MLELLAGIVNQPHSNTNTNTNTNISPEPNPNFSANIPRGVASIRIDGVSRSDWTFEFFFLDGVTDTSTTVNTSNTNSNSDCSKSNNNSNTSANSSGNRHICTIAKGPVCNACDNYASTVWGHLGNSHEYCIHCSNGSSSGGSGNGGSNNNKSDNSHNTEESTTSTTSIDFNLNTTTDTVTGSYSSYSATDNDTTTSDMDNITKLVGNGTIYDNCHCSMIL